MSQRGVLSAIHRFETATGIYRPGRSPWVWLGPGINFVGTLGVVLWAGLTYDLGWPTTVPLAIFCAVSMFAMAAAFLGNYEADAEDDEHQAAVTVLRPDEPSGGDQESPDGPPGGPAAGAGSEPEAEREPAVAAAGRPG